MGAQGFFLGFLALLFLGFLFTICNFF